MMRIANFKVDAVGVSMSNGAFSGDRLRFAGLSPAFCRLFQGAGGIPLTVQAATPYYLLCVLIFAVQITGDD
jgi:hypothetical protein